MAQDRVLLVDDEPDLQRLLTFNLRDAGFETAACGTGAEGLALVSTFDPSVVVLDVMLPDLAGTAVCRQIRATEGVADVAILLLTARGDEADRVLGFEVGADDYVVKPFSIKELVMRVRGLATRAQERRLARTTSRASELLKWRGLAVDPVRHRFYVDGSEQTLRPLEFKLVSLFLEQPGVVFSRAKLLEDVWGITADVNTRTVDTHIRRLRERLGKYGDGVETVHGFGYRLAPE